MKETPRNILSLVFCFIILIVLMTVVALSSHSVVLSANAMVVAPEIKINPSNTWTKIAEVTINYSSPVPNYYSIVNNGVESVKKEYTAPFSLDKEGNMEVKAFYTEDAVEKFVVQTYNYVDNSPPEIRSIRSVVNIMDNRPLILQIDVNDIKSGVKNVIVGAQGFVVGYNTESECYELDLINLSLPKTFDIEVVDNLGNFRKQTVSPEILEYKNVVTEYKAKYNELIKSEYAPKAWAKIVDRIDDLNRTLSVPVLNSSDINVAARFLDSAINVKTTIATKIAETLKDIDSDIVVSFSDNLNELDVKKGSVLSLEVSNSRVSANEKAGYENTIKALTSYTHNKILGFSIRIVDQDNHQIFMKENKSYVISVSVPKGFHTFEYYYQGANGALQRSTVSILDNRITARVSNTGEHFILCDLDSADPSLRQKGYVIAGKFYSAKLIGGVAGGIAGAMILVFIITYFALGKRSKSRYRLR